MHDFQRIGPNGGGGGKKMDFILMPKSPLAAAAATAAERDEEKNALKLLGGGATIRIGREILCLPYAGFFLSQEVLSICCPGWLRVTLKL